MRGVQPMHRGMHAMLCQIAAGALMVSECLTIAGCKDATGKPHRQEGTQSVPSTALWMKMSGLTFRGFSGVVLPSQHTI